MIPQPVLTMAHATRKLEYVSAKATGTAMLTATIARRTTLALIAVYSVMHQRYAVEMASAMIKQLDVFASPTSTPVRTAPSAMLTFMDPTAIDSVRHRPHAITMEFATLMDIVNAITVSTRRLVAPLALPLHLQTLLASLCASQLHQTLNSRIWILPFSPLFRIVIALMVLWTLQ